MSKTLAELAKEIGAECKGDPHCPIMGIATVQNAKKGDLTFLANPLYKKYLETTKASAVILSPADQSLVSTNALISENPYLAFAKAANLFAPRTHLSSFIHPTAVIDKNASVHPTAWIGPHVVIGSKVVIEEHAIIHPHCVIEEGAKIGARSELYSQVTIYKDVRIGQRVIIHSGAVIGSDGFGFANDRGSWYKVPQMGSVVIDNDVEIGANTTIDRGAIEDTHIEEGVKLDNQIQIGHNVRIGAHTIIAGCTAVSGSTRIGRYCFIGGAVSIAGHLDIGDRVMLTGTSAVSYSLDKPGVYSSGVGLQENKIWRKNAARFRQLDEFARRIIKLEEKLENA